KNWLASALRLPFSALRPPSFEATPSCRRGPIPVASRRHDGAPGARMRLWTGRGGGLDGLSSRRWAALARRPGGARRLPGLADPGPARSRRSLDEAHERRAARLGPASLA